MGRLTEEKKERIRLAYNSDPNYTNVARKENVDRRTVMKCVMSGREETIQERGITLGKRRESSERGKSSSSQTFKLMKRGAAPVDIAIQLDLTEEEYRNYHRQFLRLMNYQSLDGLYEKLSNDEDLSAFTQLFDRMKEEKMTDQIKEFVALVKQVTNLRESVSEMQNSLSKNQVLVNEKRTQLAGIEANIVNSTNDLNKLKKDVEILGQKWNDLDYNLKTLTGQLRVTQNRLELLKNKKIFKKAVNVVMERMRDEIKKKDDLIQFLTLATCIALRQLDQKKRELLINYSGQDRMMDEQGRTQFFGARDELKQRTTKGLSAVLIDHGLENFEDDFPVFISKHLSVEEDEDEVEEEENEEE